MCVCVRVCVRAWVCVGVGVRVLAIHLSPLQVYRIKGDVVVFTPIFLDQTDFYMSADLSLLIDVIKVSTMY